MLADAILSFAEPLISLRRERRRHARGRHFALGTHQRRKFYAWSGTRTMPPPASRHDVEPNFRNAAAHTAIDVEATVVLQCSI